MAKPKLHMAAGKIGNTVTTRCGKVIVVEGGVEALLAAGCTYLPSEATCAVCKRKS